LLGGGTDFRRPHDVLLGRLLFDNKSVISTS
jgi:hypothetical protein